MRTTITNSKIAGKKVVVIGGSSGIGLAVAQAAAELGATITIVSSRKERVTAALSMLPTGMQGLVADMADEHQVAQLFRTIGKFDHLVYTAGEHLMNGLVKDMNIDAAKRFMETRYWGAVAATKYAIPFISAQGSITFTSGIASNRPGAGWGSGASICSAMEGFARAMSVELAPVRVNIVSPGIVRTNLWSNMTEDERETLYTQEGAQLPIGRVGLAEDLAMTYVYLMQQEFCTGQTLIVDGGASRV